MINPYLGVGLWDFLSFFLRLWPLTELRGFVHWHRLEVDVVRTKLRHSEVNGWWSNDAGLTSHSASFPSRFFSCQVFSTPEYGFHPSWWWPTSNPHCSLPEPLVLLECSNISASKVSIDSASRSMLFKAPTGNRLHLRSRLNGYGFINC